MPTASVAEPPPICWRRIRQGLTDGRDAVKGARGYANRNEDGGNEERRGEKKIT